MKKRTRDRHVRSVFLQKILTGGVFNVLFFVVLCGERGLYETG